MEQTILTFYKFIPFPDFEKWKEKLEKEGNRLSILGSIILAKEGINATISGLDSDVYEFFDWIKEHELFSDLIARESFSPRKTFYRFKIFLREEIVTLGDDSVDPNELVGEYVDPEKWNDIINDPEMTVIDTRNDYEIALGTFEGAVNPKTKTFSQWHEFVQSNMSQKKDKKVAIFCTGGIRCEKASSHLLHHGFKEVYHLKGGILNYLEKIKPEKSKWIGECFLFDHRVSVVHGLQGGDSRLCFGCRWPLSIEDLHSAKFEDGVSCPKCYDQLSIEKKESLRERHRQVKLGDDHNISHIGQKMPSSK